MAAAGHRLTHGKVLFQSSFLIQSRNRLLCYFISTKHILLSPAVYA